MVTTSSKWKIIKRKGKNTAQAVSVWQGTHKRQGSSLLKDIISTPNSEKAISEFTLIFYPRI